MANHPALNRRGFLARGSAASVALASASTGLATASAFAPAPPQFPAMDPAAQACMRSFCAADFAVGQFFSVGPAGQAAALRLVSIETSGAAQERPAAARSEPFSLVFVAMDQRALASQTHEFQGTDGQRFAAFASAVGAAAHPDGQHYEVVFG